MPSVKVARTTSTRAASRAARAKITESMKRTKVKKRRIGDDGRYDGSGTWVDSSTASTKISAPPPAAMSEKEKIANLETQLRDVQISMGTITTQLSFLVESAGKRVEAGGDHRSASHQASTHQRAVGNSYTASRSRSPRERDDGSPTTDDRAASHRHDRRRSPPSDDGPASPRHDRRRSPSTHREQCRQGRHDRRPDSTAYSPPRRTVRRSTTYNTHDHPIDSPRTMRQSADADGFVQTNLDRERYATQQSDGKNPFLLDPFVDPIIKPYTFLERAGCNTLKSKLDARESMACLEYINATHKLLQNSRAYDPEDREDIMAHLTMVTRDAKCRLWADVLKWSQEVWDGVERGDFGWDDKQLIHNLKLDLALANGHQGQGHSQGQGHGRSSNSNYQNGPQGANHNLCKEFNSARGCNKASHHQGQGGKVWHFCTYCDANRNGQFTHSVINCNNKFRDGGGNQNGGYHQYGGQYQQQGGQQQAYRQQQLPPQQQQSYQGYQQPPKNEAAGPSQR